MFFLLFFPLDELSVFIFAPQWHPLLLKLREAVEKSTGCSFNSLLCNLYQDGHDSIGWHSDNEASLGAKPTIASLSLGDTRVFSLRKNPLPVRGEQEHFPNMTLLFLPFCKSICLCLFRRRRVTTLTWSGFRFL